MISQEHYQTSLRPDHPIGLYQVVGEGVPMDPSLFQDQRGRFSLGPNHYPSAICETSAAFLIHQGANAKQIIAYGSLDHSGHLRSRSGPRTLRA